MIQLPAYGCQKVVLAYSGGLDTSCLVKLFVNAGVDVVTLTADLGGAEYTGHDLDAVRQKALDLGASAALVADAKAEFAESFVAYSIMANAQYQNHYPNSTALARPLLCQYIVQAAHQTGADAIAHGATGKGNDQVRFETAIRSLDPSMKVLAPVRDLAWTRDQETAFASENGVPIPPQSAYSVDANLFGRSIECGPLEDPETVPPWDAFEWVAAPEHAPENGETVKIHFQKGVPAQLETRNETIQGTLAVIQALNVLAGTHGIGIYDHIEDRLVGFKSREVYECPAAAVLLKAHFDLEKMVLTKEELDFKQHAEKAFAEATFAGKWFTPLMDTLRDYLLQNQAPVTGWVNVKLYKGACHVNARFSPHSLYQKNVATYAGHGAFDQKNGAGFCAIFAHASAAANQVKKCWTTPDSKALTPC